MFAIYVSVRAHARLRSPSTSDALFSSPVQLIVSSVFLFFYPRPSLSPSSLFFPFFIPPAGLSRSIDAHRHRWRRKSSPLQRCIHTSDATSRARVYFALGASLFGRRAIFHPPKSAPLLSSISISRSPFFSIHATQLSLALVARGTEKFTGRYQLPTQRRAYTYTTRARRNFFRFLPLSRSKKKNPSSLILCLYLRRANRAANERGISYDKKYTLFLIGSFTFSRSLARSLSLLYPLAHFYFYSSPDHYSFRSPSLARKCAVSDARLRSHASEERIPFREKRFFPSYIYLYIYNM